jgi:hypothetical protein
MPACVCGSTSLQCVIHPGNTGTPTGQVVDDRLWALVLANLRHPLDADGEAFTFEPPLTAQEQATLDDVLRMVRAGMTDLTLAQYQAIRPHLVTIRDLRQMGRNAFMALTAAERDRLLYDAQAATTTILLAMLRE